jgi:hypothetical protein
LRDCGEDPVALRSRQQMATGAHPVFARRRTAATVTVRLGRTLIGGASTNKRVLVIGLQKLLISTLLIAAVIGAAAIDAERVLHC